ncbi:2-hydroxyacid dehydrogenase [Parasulfitobacter algicola]|uniref:Glyoxylate/hydroxypyruvate reductase A n=1 Tax=Parasulfitobacter algicola TaxID=2614809 RepID=A0ABX2IMH8_9RHOB|nr:glyoxylate/hydroxypyruvate reductase A [Sulfitobacter algicola]NSX54079.1 glyoxylate/hydroxypyruvate reductase A [Sulfitobacter algicola]
MINVLFAAADIRWDVYKDALPVAFEKAGLDVDLSRDHDPSVVDYIVYAPNSGLTDFTPFTRAKAVLNLWAGVEDVAGNQTLTIPLARMVETGLRDGMVEWVTGHVLRHHLGIDKNLKQQDGAWRQQVPPLAKDRPVTVLGLGELGATCGRMLAALKFPVTGWSRSQKDIPGITCLSGDDLDLALARADILVLLLPLTGETTNILNAERIAMMPKGAIVINPGRGALIDDDALLAALDSGHLSHATLDVFRKEPLPSDHPYWKHPQVTVTPHIASETRADTASDAIADNIKRGESGLPFVNVVDRDLGY